MPYVVVMLPAVLWRIISNQISEKRFREFLQRCATGCSDADALTTSDISLLVSVLDSKCEGVINYNKFLKKVWNHTPI
jgi:hypothetical protein